MLLRGSDYNTAVRVVMSADNRRTGHIRVKKDNKEVEAVSQSDSTTSGFKTSIWTRWKCSRWSSTVAVFYTVCALNKGLVTAFWLQRPVKVTHFPLCLSDGSGCGRVWRKESQRKWPHHAHRCSRHHQTVLQRTKGTNKHVIEPLQLQCFMSFLFNESGLICYSSFSSLSHLHF